jgi:hypothetical protein
MSHTHRPFEPFEPPRDTLGIHLRNKLLKECLPDLEWIEGTSKTSMVRRALIAEIRALTMDKGN